MTDVVLDITGVSKDYRGLRPLRIEQLTVGATDRVALLGFDATTAQVFVDLVTGTTLPDRGEIRVFGRSTAAIDDGVEWLSVVDRFGIVSDRAVLLETLSVVQNLSVPFTLQIEPPSDEVRARALGLAREAGLASGLWDRPIAELDPLARARVRLARALALGPAALLLEHASASLPRTDVATFGAALRAVAAGRGIAIVAATADEGFAKAVATHVLTLEAATGRLTRRRGWFRRRREPGSVCTP